MSSYAIPVPFRFPSTPVYHNNSLLSTLDKYFISCYTNIIYKKVVGTTFARRRPFRAFSRRRD